MKFLITVLLFLLPLQAYCVKLFWPDTEPMNSGGAKKCTETVKYYFAGQEPEVYRIHHYDEKGRIIKKEIYPNTPTRKTEVYTYNIDGQILSLKNYGGNVPINDTDIFEEKWDEQELTEFRKYHYANSRLVRRDYVTYNYRKPFTVFEVYEYDSYGRLVSSKDITPPDKDSNMSISYVDKHGKTHIRYGDTTINLYNYTDTSIAVIHRYTGMPDSKTIYTINKGGQTTASRHIGSDGKVYDHTVYIYNEQKQHTNILYKKRTRSQAEAGPVLTNTLIEYDEKGRIKKMSDFSGHKLASTHSFTYE